MAIHDAHPDIVHVVPEGVVYRKDETAELMNRGALAPMRSPWQVLVLEDADRLNDTAANALLKAIEEPNPQTVWVLCAPTTEDVLPTIRSRCRHITLVTPTVADVAATLVARDSVDPAMAAFAARAAQGHIGRARALARDEAARLRRAEVLRVPLSLTDLPSAFALAADLVATANADADAIVAPIDAAEIAAMREAYGEGAEGKGIVTVERRSKGALKDLADRHKRRARRTLRDQLDRILIDLTGFYRDVLMVQTQAPVALINEELRGQLSGVAAAGHPDDTVRRLAAIDLARRQLANDVTPLLVFESLLVTLRDPVSLTAAH
jgi:DNA polymerase-3 subunit delta'